MDAQKIAEERNDVLPAERDKLEEICHVHQSQLNTTQNRLDNIRKSKHVYERAMAVSQRTQADVQSLTDSLQWKM